MLGRYRPLDGAKSRQTHKGKAAQRASCGPSTLPTWGPAALPPSSGHIAVGLVPHAPTQSEVRGCGQCKAVWAEKGEGGTGLWKQPSEEVLCREATRAVQGALAHKVTQRAAPGLESRWSLPLLFLTLAGAHTALTCSSTQRSSSSRGCRARPGPVPVLGRRREGRALASGALGGPAAPVPRKLPPAQHSLCASTRSLCMLYGTSGSGSSEKKLFMAPATVFTVKSFSAKSRLWSKRRVEG